MKTERKYTDKEILSFIAERIVEIIEDLPPDGIMTNMDLMSISLDGIDEEFSGCGLGKYNALCNACEKAMLKLSARDMN